MKLAILIGTIIVFLLVSALAVLGWYCAVGTLADMATTPMGQLPWVAPGDDTERFRTNMTILMSGCVVLIGLAYRALCGAIGRAGGKLHGMAS